MEKKYVPLGLSVLFFVTGGALLGQSIIGERPGKDFQKISVENTQDKISSSENITDHVCITLTDTDTGIKVVSGIPYHPYQKVLKSLDNVSQVNVSPESTTFRSTNGIGKASATVTVTGSSGESVEIPLEIMVQKEWVFNSGGTGKVFIYVQKGKISKLKTIDVTNASAVFTVKVEPRDRGLW